MSDKVRNWSVCACLYTNDSNVRTLFLDVRIPPFVNVTEVRIKAKNWRNSPPSSLTLLFTFYKQLSFWPLPQKTPWLIYVPWLQRKIILINPIMAEQISVNSSFGSYKHLVLHTLWFVKISFAIRIQYLYTCIFKSWTSPTECAQLVPLCGKKRNEIINKKSDDTLASPNYMSTFSLKDACSTKLLLELCNL